MTIVRPLQNQKPPTYCSNFRSVAVPLFRSTVSSSIDTKRAPVMQVQRVNDRLQQVHGILNRDTQDSSSTRQRVAVLPDGVDLFVSRSDTNSNIATISLHARALLSFSTTNRSAALVLSALGTPFENAHAVPRYPVLKLCAVPSTISLSSVDLSLSTSDFWVCVYALWMCFRTQENIPLVLSESILATFRTYLLQSGLARHAADPEERALFLLRGAFWQGAGTGPLWGNMRGWLRHELDYALFPHTQTFTRSETVIAQHPLRPQKPSCGTVLYRRFCSEVRRMLELRVLDPGDGIDMEAFHRWMNDERVNSGWGEQGDMEKHHAYVKGVLDDPAVIPIIMSWDGERMGYSEIVWVKENHVAPYIPSGAHDYDRGLHVLVGENKFRGQAFSQAWFRSLEHYAFLADSRTERMIGEPKRDNAAIMRTTSNGGMHYESPFYFPYKYSALMICLRERFFKEDMLL